jgi:hypothetical protein
MTFLAWGFLFAALAAAIPVVLHMINRQRAKDLPFPTLRFLRISVQKTRRRKRIHDLLLMLIRALVLILIAFGLADMRLTTLKSLLGGGAKSAVAIILDNSASMGTTDPERPRFETATNAVQQILDELQGGDQVALFPTCGESLPDQDQLDDTQTKVQQVLALCRQRGVTYERADLAAKLRQARKLLAGSKASHKQIYVISDFQPVSWEALKKEAESAAEEGEEADREEQEARQIPVICVDCDRRPRANVAVQKVAFDAPMPIVNMPIKVNVELLNTSVLDQKRRVELVVDDRKEDLSPVLSLKEHGRAAHEFRYTPTRGGVHRCEVRLAGDDGSPYDDRRFFSIQVDREIPVAVVKPARHEIPFMEESYYLENALATVRALRLTTLTAGDLTTERLDTFKVIFLVNLPAPAAEVAERLRAYVEQGGNLVWCAGDAVNPDQYNAMNQAAGGGLLPAPLVDVRAPGPQAKQDSWRINFLDRQHRAMSRPSLLKPPELYRSVLIYKHVRFDVPTGHPDDVQRGVAPWVLIRLEQHEGDNQSEPLLVQRNLAQGRVLMLGTSVHVDWSNFSRKNLFLPLLGESIYYLAGTEYARHELLAGAPLVLEMEGEKQPVRVEIRPPGGGRIGLNTEPGKQGQELQYEKTHKIGNYLVSLPNATKPTEFAYSVNLDPAETMPSIDSAETRHTEIEKSLSPTPVVFAEDPDNLSSTFEWLRQGTSLWKLFLTAVLIALVFETLISNRLGPKQDEQQAAAGAAVHPTARRNLSPA